MLYYETKTQQLINDSRQPTLENMQECVGGLIQIIPDSNLSTYGIQAAVNEEGLIYNLPPGLVFEYNHRPIPTVGNALFLQTPDEEGDTHDLTEVQIKAVEDYLGLQATTA